METTPKYIKELEVFNETYEKLLSLSFTRNLENLSISIACLNGDIKPIILDEEGSLQGKITLTSKENQKLYIEVKGPKGEEIDSFILTFRLFIQNNERVSIKNISDIYEKQVSNIDYVNKIRVIRNNLNSYLDEIVQNSRNIANRNERITITRREIIDSIIYGLYAHYKADKRDFYENYLSHDDFFAFFQKPTVRDSQYTL